MNIDEIDVEEFKRKLLENSQREGFSAEDVSRELLNMGLTQNKCQSLLQKWTDEKIIIIQRAIFFS
jgi:hypothetical protein